MTAGDLARLTLRVWLGVVMLALGRHHLREYVSASWFASIGFRAALLGGWVGAVLAAAGVGAGAAQHVTSWRTAEAG